MLWLSIACVVLTGFAVFLYGKLSVLANPDEVILYAGMPRENARGSVLQGTRVLRRPVVENIVLMNAAPLVVRAKSRAVTQHQVPLQVGLEATFHVARETPRAEEAAMRLLKLLEFPRQELEALLQDVVSAAAREVCSSHSAEEIVGNAVHTFEEAVCARLEHHVQSWGLSAEQVSLKQLQGPEGFFEALGVLHGETFAQNAARLAQGNREKPQIESPPEASAVGAAPLAFLPSPDLGLKMKATAVDPSGAKVQVKLNADVLELTTDGNTIASIALDAPFTVMLSHSTDGDETLLHIDIRQQRMGASTRLGLSSTTASFSHPVHGLTMQPNAFPRLEESDMLRLITALRGLMQAQGEESWGYM